MGSLGRPLARLAAAWPRARSQRLARLASTSRSMAGSADRQEESLDPNHLMTQSRWTTEERKGVAQTHRPPRDWVDKAALYSVKALRLNFDVVSFYKVKNAVGRMRERDWVRRIIVLETVAGVPGMVAGMVRHLHSLRLMRRDRGWIHMLLAEAENERMHLLIALQLRKPGPLMRAAVLAGQFFFLSFYTLAYLVSPRYCHRFVGYLEEEAIKTYTHLLHEMDAGNLPGLADKQAPAMARVYYSLDENATMREVVECIRADESAHRDTNHRFGDMRADEPNTMVDHLRKDHFRNQETDVSWSQLRGVRQAKEQSVLDELKKLDAEGTGTVPEEALVGALERTGDKVPGHEIRRAIEASGRRGDGRVPYEEFVRRLYG